MIRATPKNSAPNVPEVTFPFRMPSTSNRDDQHPAYEPHGSFTSRAVAPATNGMYASDKTMRGR